MKDQIQGTVLLAEAVDYFTSNKGFSRLFKGMMRKYQSLGRWGGSVTLTSLKEEERESLSTFFRQDYLRQKSITISLERFALALEETRFGVISAVNLLEAIHGEPLISHAEALAQKEQARIKFFKRFTTEYTDLYCQSWLQAIQDKSPRTRLVHQGYERDVLLMQKQMVHVLNTLIKLHNRSSQELFRLPILAREITKDPHGFDPNTELGRLLINALSVLSNQQSGEENSDRMIRLTTAEELTELYFTFGILRDDLWNFVTGTGLFAASEGDQPVRYLQEANREQITLNLPLREVVKFTKVFSIAESKPQQMFKVFITENSGVLSALLDYFEEYRQQSDQLELPNPPLICTHGQFKLAGLLLLDKLVASGATLYYSGDFDPEGLLMVDRLMQRYPRQVIPWHYGLNDYRISLSDQHISTTRLKKLAGIHSPELIPLKEEILRTNLAGFQEGILELLWKDIRIFTEENLKS